jgi:hypothetical protein
MKTKYILAQNYANQFDKEYRENAENDYIAGYEAASQKILAICQGNTEYMWAAKIVSTLLDCDFRDSSVELKKYLEENNNE